MLTLMNKKTFRIFAVILAVTVVVVGMPFYAASKTANGFTFEVFYDRWVMITGYNGYDSVVTVPKTLDFKPVRSIGEWAFAGSDITEVNLPSSVKCVYDNAFKNCKSLKKVNFSDGIESVQSAFGNTSLESITFPESVEYLSGTAFEGCENLRKIKFIADYRKNLDISTIRNNGMGENAEIIFGALPSAEADLALRQAGYIPEKTADGIRYAVSAGEAVTTVKSGGYTYIVHGNEAELVGFDYNSETVLDIPEVIDGLTVTSIGDYAFSPMTGDNANTFSDDYANVYKFREVTVPDTVKSIGRYAFAGNRSLHSVHLSENVTVLDYGTFMNCTRLSTVNIPEKISGVYDYAFLNCDLSQLDLPNGIKRIYKSAFAVSNTLTDQNLPDSVEYLGDNALGECEYTTLTLPEKLKAVGKTFCNCETLESITFNPSIERINGTFSGCVGLKEINIPDSLYVLGEASFKACSSLKKVRMSANVECIEEDAFAGCTSLYSFKWNSKIKQISSSAFQDCPLRDFDFSGSDGIESGAFIGSSIKKAEIGKGSVSEEKQSIGAMSFMSCADLETVAIGGSIAEINSQAFACCSNLETVIIANSVENIAPDAFDESDNVTIYCFSNSYAQAYAEEQNIKVTTLVVAPIPNQTFTTKEIKPTLSVTMSGNQLKVGKDYSVDYYNNINVGTASTVVTGTGDFSMMIAKANFAIVARSISDTEISGINDFVFNGQPCEPQITVKYNRQTLVNGKDYTVSYENNASVGTGTVKVKGIGNFKGTQAIDFEIKEAKEPSGFKKFLNRFVEFWRSIINWFKNIFK